MKKKKEEIKEKKENIEAGKSSKCLT
jgi:hypothetical protein